MQSDVVVAVGGREIALFRFAAAILILNLLDGILTLIAVQAGAATEANPLMATSLNWGGLWFIVVKMTLVSLGVSVLWRSRRHLVAASGLVGLCLFYVLILAYHMSSLEFVASHLT